MPRNPTNGPPPPFEIGQWVAVKGLSRPARVVRLYPDRGEAEVQAGGITLRVSQDHLTPSEPPAEGETGREPDIQVAPGVGGPVEYELDLHGMRVAEALESLEKFLDSALVNRVDSVKVIHGHGTGKLREAVRRRLAKHPGVRDFRFGDPVHGGLAVTVVYLADR